jgi:hypothetical protein
MHDDSATSTIRRHPAGLCGLFATALLLASPSTLQAQTRLVTFSWDANRESDLAGYIVSYGAKSHEYATHIDVGNVTSRQLTVVPGRRYFFAVRAYNTSGYQSGYSNEVQYGGTPPTLTRPPNQTSPASRAVALQLTASDLDGDTITYAASGLPPGITINSVTGLISGTPGANGIGTFTVTATAADRDGSSAQTLTWVVTGPAGDPDGDLKAVDFNIDGHPDLVWQNDTTRQAAVWYMTGAQGNVFLGENYLGDLGSAGVPGWRVVAAGDFNADGHPDLVCQSDILRQVAVWYMGGVQGSDFLSGNWLDDMGAAGVPGWTVAGTGDFNADGHPDLMWQNEMTRQVTIWYMGGAQGNVFLGWNWLGDAGAAGVPGWLVVGTRDFNDDGHPDVVWQNEMTRQVTIWYMGGAQGNVFLGWNWLGNLGAVGAVGMPGWMVGGTADFNNDGHPDVLWQNDMTRQVTIWYMGGPQGNVFQDWAWLSEAGVPGWKVILR